MQIVLLVYVQNCFRFIHLMCVTCTFLHYYRLNLHQIYCNCAIDLQKDHGQAIFPQFQITGDPFECNNNLLFQARLPTISNVKSSAHSEILSTMKSCNVSYSLGYSQYFLNLEDFFFKFWISLIIIMCGAYRWSFILKL